MALGGDLPPWISVTPRDFVLAAQAGAQLGHQIANSTLQAWEEQAKMRMAAQEHAAAREDAAQQRAVDNAMARLAADRLEQYRQSEIANRKAELGIQQQGLGLRGESLEIARQRNEDLFNLREKALQAQSGKQADLDAQRKAMNDFREREADRRDRETERRQQLADRDRVHTKLSAGEFGPELSGPMDSPAIVQRLKEIKDAEEAKRNAPNLFSRAYNYLTGQTPASTTPSGGTIPMNPAYPYPNDVAAPPPQPVSSKVQRATDLYKKHPDWTKQQIIDAVNTGVE